MSVINIDIILIINKGFNQLVEKSTYRCGIEINSTQCLTHRPPVSPSLTINIVTSPYIQNLIFIIWPYVHFEVVKKRSIEMGLHFEVESTCNG